MSHDLKTLREMEEKALQEYLGLVERLGFSNMPDDERTLKDARARWKRLSEARKLAGG